MLKFRYSSYLAWHGYVGTPDMMSKAHSAHPDANMYWTEGEPDYTSPTYARQTADTPKLQDASNEQTTLPEA